jgi:hypothetical protein
LLYVSPPPVLEVVPPVALVPPAPALAPPPVETEVLPAPVCPPSVLVPPAELPAAPPVLPAPLLRLPAADELPPEETLPPEVLDPATADPPEDDELLVPPEDDPPEDEAPPDAPAPPLLLVVELPPWLEEVPWPELQAEAANNTARIEDRRARSVFMPQVFPESRFSAKLVMRISLPTRPKRSIAGACRHASGHRPPRQSLLL